MIDYFKSEWKGLLIAWAVVSALVLGCTGPAKAQPRVADPPAAPEWSQALAADRETIVRMHYRVRRCMYGASLAMFRQGVTARDPVTTFAIRTCSGEYGRLLRDRAGWTEIDAAMLIVEMSDHEYDDALSWGRSRR